MICHNPHGTVSRGLLNMGEPALCLQCHEFHFHRRGRQLVRDPAAGGLRQGSHHGDVHPTRKVELGLSLNYVKGEASMGSFDLSRPDFSARFPNSSYDLSRTPDWSDLDVDGTDAWVDLKHRFTRNVFARGACRYVKYDDNEPYLYDLTGRNSLLYFSLGYLFWADTSSTSTHSWAPHLGAPG